MARKIRPNKLFTSLQDTASAVEATPVEMPTKEIDADENSLVGNGRLSAIDAEKLARYDAIEKSLAEISKEKDMLEAKVAEYVDKLDALKNSDDEIKKLQDEVLKHKARCDELEKSCSSIDALKKEIAILKEDNDQYLIKISELTFENANLTCQLSELEKKTKHLGGRVANSNAFAPSLGMQPQSIGGLAQPNRDAYNPYINNGYGTW